MRTLEGEFVLTPEFARRSGVDQGCFQSPSPFNFVIRMVIEIISSSCENTDNDIRADRHLPDLRFADDAVLLNKDSSNMQDYFSSSSE